MKHLYIIRHAKSSWKELGVDDFERDLNKRGKKDAPMMASVLADRLKDVELIISSPAKRAKKTAKCFSNELNKELELADELYEAELSTLKKIIKENFDRYDSIAVVGHNPSLNEFVESLDIGFTENIVTAGVVGISFESTSLDNPKLLFFEYPKKYR